MDKIALYNYMKDDPDLVTFFALANPLPYYKLYEAVRLSNQETGYVRCKKCKELFKFHYYRSTLIGHYNQHFNPDPNRRPSKSSISTNHIHNKRNGNHFKNSKRNKAIVKQNSKTQYIHLHHKGKKYHLPHHKTSNIEEDIETREDNFRQIMRSNDVSQNKRKRLTFQKRIVPLEKPITKVLCNELKKEDSATKELLAIRKFEEMPASTV